MEIVEPHSTLCCRFLSEPLSDGWVPIYWQCGVVTNRIEEPCVGNFGAIARVAELADAPDLGSGIARCAGSSPVSRTNGCNERQLAAANGNLWQKAPITPGLFAFLGDAE